MRTKLPFLFMLLSLCAAATAAPDEIGGAVRQSQHTYKVVGTTELTLHVFEPAGRRAGAPVAAIIFFHGGGWAYGDPADFFGACRRYAAMGFVTFSVEYRLSDNPDGKNPQSQVTPIECVMDARSAVRWVRAHAGEYHLNPDKVIVGGQSVGGHLTLATAMIDTFNEATDDLSISPVPNAMLLYSGTPNTIEAWCDYLLGERRSSIWAISPAHHIRSNLPPTLAFHGVDDPIVAFWKMARFQADMVAHGNLFELHSYPGRGHRLAEGNPEYAQLFDEAILAATDAFLRRHGFM